MYFIIKLNKSWMSLFIVQGHSERSPLKQTIKVFVVKSFTRFKSALPPVLPEVHNNFLILNGTRCILFFSYVPFNISQKCLFHLSLMFSVVFEQFSIFIFYPIKFGCRVLYNFRVRRFSEPLFFSIFRILKTVI